MSKKAVVLSVLSAFAIAPAFAASYRCEFADNKDTPNTLRSYWVSVKPAASGAAEEVSLVHLIRYKTARYGEPSASTNNIPMSLKNSASELTRVYEGGYRSSLAHRDLTWRIAVSSNTDGAVTGVTLTRPDKETGLISEKAGDTVACRLE